jgi:hypothetical protein
VTTKKTCCQDTPRCTTCPVVLIRLEKDGLAECCSRGKRGEATYRVRKKVAKEVLKGARAR